ncbi:MAG: hypothetical protein GY719_25940 [bacterium]|nr:hypothetical protein [bacterium]
MSIAALKAAQSRLLAVGGHLLPLTTTYYHLPREQALADYVAAAESVSPAQAQRARRMARAIETGDTSNLSEPQRQRLLRGTTEIVA